jgi:two-component system, OmpR family, sensor histidine kinase PhoQ
VTYQLQRAVSSQQQGSHQRTVVESVVQRLTKVLLKVYADKNMDVKLELDAGAVFAGDEQDLMEMLGNITENAFKYGKSCVHISCKPHGKQLLIAIADDGPGVPADQERRILERGQRLDTSIPGQGIGLAVAADIIHSYDGDIRVTQSALGGAEFRIILPLGI